jgi:hypothetical protein
MAAGGTDPEVSGGIDPAGKGKKKQEMRAFRWAGTPAFFMVIRFGDWRQWKARVTNPGARRAV